jgi:hypothetical protein
VVNVEGVQSTAASANLIFSGPSPLEASATGTLALGSSPQYPILTITSITDPEMQLMSGPLNGFGIPSGTQVLQQLSGATGGLGTYQLINTTGNSFVAGSVSLYSYGNEGSFNALTTGSVTSNGILTVTAPVIGTITNALLVSIPGNSATAYVTAQLSGAPGGAGTYQLTIPGGGAFNPAPAGALTFNSNNPISSGTETLITNWYATGIAPNYNFGFIPYAWYSSPPTAITGTNYSVQNVYSDVIARSCRTCHTAITTADWDSIGYPNAPSFFAGFAVGTALPNGFVCSVPPSMPNSATTFNRLWDSHVYNLSSPTPLEDLGPDQVDELLALHNFVNTSNPISICGPP